MYALPFLLLVRLHQAALDARRKSRTWSYFVWATLASVCAVVVLFVGTVVSLFLFKVGLWWLALVAVALLLVPMIGPIVIRHAFVPLGWYRAAYWVGYASRPGKDPLAYGLTAAGWALANDPTGIAWVSQRRDTRRPLGDAEVVATALIAAARGDSDTARLLMRSVLMLVEVHPTVRELAGEWLACDAAERGAWRELADDSVHARFPASPLTLFLEGVALRRTGADNAPSMAELRTRWVLAPRHRHTRPLLEQAATFAPPAPTVPEDPPAEHIAEPLSPPDRAPLPRAISAHLAFGTGKPSELALGATVRAWDAALSDGGTHSWLARRALELDAPLGAVDRALREIATAVTNDLARIADAARLGAPASHGPIGDALGRRLRHGRLDTLEAGFTRWSNRRTNGEIHVAIDEWREFIALKTSYTTAVTAGGPELRRLAFPHAFSTGSNMAAWLWNSRNEYPLSHAISKWLLEEALAVGDTEAIELGHKNCELYVPTRTGDD